MNDEERSGVQMPLVTKPQVQEQLRKNKMMTIVDALSLRNAETPSLTIDGNGHPSLFVGRGKDVNSSYNILSPLAGEEKQYNKDNLAAKHEQLGIDVTESDSTREPMEAVIVCLDTSNSMNNKAEFLVEEGNEDNSVMDYSFEWDGMDMADDDEE